MSCILPRTPWPAVARSPARPRTDLALAVLLLALLSACAGTRGPALVVNSHIEYNKAVSQVLKEELLLNIVRRRYMEAPQFLNVSSISSNFQTSRSIGASVDIADWSSDNVRNAGIDGSVTLTDSPTITLTPRQGEDIASQLHEPLAVSTVADLVAAGYRFERVLDLLVESVNGVDGPEMEGEEFRPSSPEWREALDLIERLIDARLLVVDRFEWDNPYNSHPYAAEAITPAMWITTLSTGNRRWISYDGGQTFYFTNRLMGPGLFLKAEALETADGQRLVELLNMRPDPRRRVWFFKPAKVGSGPDESTFDDTPRDILRLRMRSLYGVLNLYSYAVQVPIDHEIEGRATDLSPFRQAIERGEMVNLLELLAIRSSEEAPENAFQVVRYRNRWFYIDDRDRMSKKGFNALYDLWQLSIQSPARDTEPTNVIQVN